MTNVPNKMKYLECVFDLCAEDHDEPVEAGEEKDDDDEPVGHDVVARLNLQIEIWIPFCLFFLFLAKLLFPLAPLCSAASAFWLCCAQPPWNIKREKCNNFVSEEEKPNKRR